MLCRLCLVDADVDGSIGIFNEPKIQTYVSKYLQLELKCEVQVSTICSSCWYQLDSFHNFHTKIVEAQKTFTAAIENLSQESNQNYSDNVPANYNVQSAFQLHIKERNENPLVQNLQIKSETCPDFEQLKLEIDVEANNVEEMDDNGDDDNTYCRDEGTIKVEIQNECSPDASEAEETGITQRVTRRSIHKKVENVSLASKVLVKRKRGRPRKESVNDIEAIEADKRLDQQPNSEPNEKRNRGRPRRGEIVTPKVKTIKSEKCLRILQTAKEFDEIIQKNMPLLCDICSIGLTDFAELKRHFRTIHQRSGYAVCCNKRLFKRGLVVDHINTHINPEYFKCTECGKVLADRMCLRTHTLYYHQPDEVQVYHCEHCPKKYAKQYLLDHHKIKHATQEECSFICPHCGKGFPLNSILTQHINLMHSNDNAIMCEICAKLLRGNAAYEKHMQEHRGIVQPQVQCQICGSWLKDKNNLRKHMYKHEGKTYTCKECGKVAHTKRDLKSHEKYVHKLARDFHCSFCDKSFKKAVILKEHLSTHTGEVLYTCPHCPQTFNSKANMHSHRKKKHREEWEANRRYQKKKPQTNVVQSVSNQDIV